MFIYIIQLPCNFLFRCASGWFVGHHPWPRCYIHQLHRNAVVTNNYNATNNKMNTSWRHAPLRRSRDNALNAFKVQTPHWWTTNKQQNNRISKSRISFLSLFSNPDSFQIQRVFTIWWFFLYKLIQPEKYSNCLFRSFPVALLVPFFFFFVFVLVCVYESTASWLGNCFVPVGLFCCVCVCRREIPIVFCVRCLLRHYKMNRLNLALLRAALALFRMYVNGRTIQLFFLSLSLL